MSLLLALNIIHTLFSVFIVNFEQADVGWIALNLSLSFEPNLKIWFSNVVKHFFIAEVYK